MENPLTSAALTIMKDHETFRLPGPNNPNGTLNKALSEPYINTSVIVHRKLKLARMIIVDCLFALEGPKYARH